MAGKLGQRASKVTEVNQGPFVVGFLHGMDRRYRSAQMTRKSLADLIERCGGDDALDEEEKTRLEFYVYQTRLTRLAAQAGVVESVEAEAAYRRARRDAKRTGTPLPRRPRPRRSPVPEAVVNDSMRSWLALDRRVELLKARNRQDNHDLARAIQAELAGDRLD